MYKIAVTGPESTGKTMLVEALANYYQCPFVPEYARQYIESLDRPYNQKDVEIIAHKQIAAEQYYTSNQGFDFVFFDTELIITKVWFDYCYGHTPPFVINALQTGFFDLYLLCEPDLPWVPDAVREHGSDREYFFELYRKEIEKLGKPYRCIQGTGEIRIQQAIQAINSFFDCRKCV